MSCSRLLYPLSSQGPIGRPKLDDSLQQKQLCDAGKSSLFYTLTRSKSHATPKTAVLNTATLQKLKMQQIQFEIAEHVAKSYEQGRVIYKATDKQGLFSLDPDRSLPELLSVVL